MDRLNGVLPYIKQRRCALFIGAGLSKIAGCYDWKTVVETMLEHFIFQERGVNKEELISQEEYENLLTYCHNIFRDNGKEDEYWGLVREAIIFNSKLYQKKYLPLIMLLRSIDPFPQIITTNIDNCLESSKQFKLSNIYYRPEQFIEDNLNHPSIFHIHGYVEDLRQSVLRREQYISRYYEPEFQVFLKSIFKKYSLIFIGYSLRDKEILDIMLETNNEVKKDHFLLVPEEDDLSSSKMSFLRALYGIESIIYGTRDNFGNAFGSWITKNFKTVKLGTGNTGEPNV